MMLLLLFVLAVPTSPAFVKTPLNGYEVDWAIDSEIGTLLLTLKVNTSGWIGFGISASGAMQGSDIVRVSGDGQIEDSYTIDEQFPLRDCKQDWSLVRRSVVNGVTEVMLSRALNTSDKQDHPLIDDGVSNRVIIAYGNTKQFSYHGEATRSSMRLNFFRRSAATSIESDSFFDFLVHNPNKPNEPFEIPVNGNVGGVNTYTDYCMDIPSELLSKPVHLTDIEAMITPGNELVVHHFLIYTSEYSCSNRDAMNHRSLIWAYGGAGTSALHLPPEVGIRLSNVKSLHNNVHYYNTEKKAGLKDESGVRIHYTTTLRLHDMGMMGFGDWGQLNSGRSLTEGQGQNPAPLARWQYQCTIANLAEGESVTSFMGLQHMHRDGFAFNTRVEDKHGTIKKDINTSFYRGDLQDTSNFSQAIKIEKGDKVTTDCIFNVAGGTGTQKFGLGSEDEMCIEWLYYYPKKSALEKSCEYGQAGQFVKAEGLKVSDLARDFGTESCDHNLPSSTTTTTTTTTTVTATATATTTMTTTTITTAATTTLLASVTSGCSAMITSGMVRSLICIFTLFVSGIGSA